MQEIDVTGEPREPLGPIIPMSEWEREQFPTVIYELASGASAAYETAISAVLRATQKIGLQLAADVIPDEDPNHETKLIW